jgi:ABC-2 type transport system permease protein
MMFKLWATITKDVRVLLRDKVGILLMFIMPIALVIVVTSIQNSTFELMNKNKLVLLVSNQDTGKLSPQLIQAIDKIGMFKVQELPKGSDSAVVNGKLHDKAAELAIIIPPDFSAKVGRARQSIIKQSAQKFWFRGRFG